MSDRTRFGSWTALRLTRSVSKRRPRLRSTLVTWSIAVCGLVGVMLAGLEIGAIHLSPVGVLATLADRLPLVHLDPRLSSVEQSVLLQLRLPRVLLGALVGGLLAIAGAGYQGVFRNPLADPYLLGASSGAGLGATLIIGYGGHATIAGIGVLPLAAFGGALGGVLLAYLLGATARRSGGGTATLVLAGVAVSSFLAAMETYFQQANVNRLREVYAWILGDLSSAGWHGLGLVAPYAAMAVLVLLLHGRALDVLAVGDDEAAGLGLNVRRVRLIVLVTASLATACAVAESGLIGFVGLVAPHMVRRMVGGGNRRVLPLSLLLGAAFLVLSDMLARTVVAPNELPIGVVTAFIGAPFFMLILRTSRPAE